MILLAKTVPGIEDIASRELMEKLGCNTLCTRPARVIIECDFFDEQAFKIPLLKTIHGLYLVLAHEEIRLDDKGLEEARNIASSIDWSMYVPRYSSFAVRSERVGSGHAYTSMQLAASIGDVIHSQLSHKNWNVKVNLNAPTVSVGAEVIYNEFFLLLQLYGEQSYHRRWYRIYEHQASLKPSIAYAMLEIAELKDKARLLDPVCGGGTIPIEAALEHEDIDIICSDNSPQSIRMARGNAVLARVEKRIKFLVYRASQLIEILDKDVTHIIGNPPYGLRVGSLKKARETLHEILLLAEKKLSYNGRLVLISPDKNYVIENAVKYGFELYESRRIRHGDLYVWIFGFEKL